MSYYILRKDGAYAGVCCGAGRQHLRRFAVHDATASDTRTAVALFQGHSIGWPPMPGNKQLSPEQKQLT